VPGRQQADPSQDDAGWPAATGQGHLPRQAFSRPGSRTGAAAVLPQPRAVRGAPARCGLWLGQPQPVVPGEVREIEGGERQLVGKAAGSHPGVVDRAGPPALGGRG
jgi:hypothetical protein